MIYAKETSLKQAQQTNTNIPVNEHDQFQAPANNTERAKKFVS